MITLCAIVMYSGKYLNLSLRFVALPLEKWIEKTYLGFFTTNYSAIGYKTLTRYSISSEDKSTDFFDPWRIIFLCLVSIL